MVQRKVLVIGLGEVGRPLYEIIKESDNFSVFGYDLDLEKIKDVKTEMPKIINVMHVCIPCKAQKSFVESVVEYIRKFSPKLTIINSTIPPRTTEIIHEQCGGHLAHSPIRGVHKNVDHMKWELKRWIKYIGGVDQKSAELASKHFRTIGLKVKVLQSSTETELAKLFETIYRAWMIVCFQEMHRINNNFGTKFSDVVDFLGDTHVLRGDRPIMYPDAIGGHCLIPNTKLLLKAFDSDLLRLILKSNETRKGEILQPSLKKEIEEIRSIADTFQIRLLRSLEHP